MCYIARVTVSAWASVDNSRQAAQPLKDDYETWPSNRGGRYKDAWVRPFGRFDPTVAPYIRFLEYSRVLPGLFIAMWSVFLVAMYASK